MSTSKQVSVSEEDAERIAKQATRSELGRHQWITPEEQERLVLGWGMTDGDYHYELYLTGASAGDAAVLAHTVVDGRTGAVSVTVNLPPKPAGTR